ncbi:hypothetical protein AVEN_42368-1 [Araneus ventricosus]|uniref:Uncharacterized protein n=1 Tax=Araneus ventricosus TaxID=182803 RepID=A0A4Y2UU83_ARAVE|nr:hypothetical protein AVEN_112740-1 [Araneus ventricosus]GBO15751.1 hypothetical protein AVEN_42368-1 [Araneus ventricosus]
MTHQILWSDIRGTDFETSPRSRGLIRVPVQKSEERAPKRKEIFTILPELSCQSNHFFLPFMLQLWCHGQLPGPQATSALSKLPHNTSRIFHHNECNMHNSTYMKDLC